MLYAIESGVEIEVLSGFRFASSVRPFNSYVRALFERKRFARGVLRSLYKTLLNGLYGKYGQKGSRIVAMSLKRFEALPAKPLAAKVWCGLAIWRVDGEPPFWANNLWSAIVTARARIKLRREMASLVESRARLVYCDTDGILFTGGKVRYPEQASEPGDFERRGHYRRALIVGKKEYALEIRPGVWEPHAKGIPYAERMEYLETGKVGFDRPVRLLESMRIGIAANVWRRVEKIRRAKLEKGGRTADGSLLPITIGG